MIYMSEPMMNTEPSTLLDVIKIIPKDCYNNPTLKGMSYVVRSFALYFIVITALLSTNTWWLVVPLIVVAGAMVSGLFVIGHCDAPLRAHRSSLGSWA
jgi:fatty acid desaturase